jgi:hypothetical protein
LVCVITAGALFPIRYAAAMERAVFIAVCRHVATLAVGHQLLVKARLA